MERAIGMTVKMIRLHAGDQGAAKLDSRVRKIDMGRQSERSAFPLSTFPNGLTNLTKIMAQEYPSIVLQVISILAGDKRQELLPKRQSARIIAALNELYKLWLVLEQESHLYDDVGDGYIKRIKRYV